MNEFQPLIDQLYREEVEQARALGPEGRLRVGFEIIDENLRWARSLGDAEMHYAPPFQRS